jgi:hypothetical protein
MLKRGTIDTPQKLGYAAKSFAVRGLRVLPEHRSPAGAGARGKRPATGQIPELQGELQGLHVRLHPIRSVSCV